ncbi:MAG TPA: MBL fold metallo-hydrolase, partial [Planctomycetes bacterium]|nr:MBL fold metallo-hydrolase [Planctomycetota bacterium]
MKIGDWFVVPLFEGMMAIDGGAAFGVIPWTDWSEWMAPDAQNRVDLSLCFFLVQGRGHNLLIDTGFGDKRSPEEMETLGVRKRATTGEL